MKHIFMLNLGGNVFSDNHIKAQQLLIDSAEKNRKRFADDFELKAKIRYWTQDKTYSVGDGKPAKSISKIRSEARQGFRSAITLKADAFLLSYLQKHPHTNPRAIGEAYGIQGARAGFWAHKCLNRLIRDGKVRKVGRGKYEVINLEKNK